MGASGGGKGGSQTTTQTTKLPAWVEAEAKRNARLADEVAKMPFVPNQSATIAGFTPQQVEAMRGTNQLASQFGQSSTRTPDRMSQDEVLRALTGLSAPTQNSQGVRGYAPYESYRKMMEDMNPYQKAMIDSFFQDAQGRQPTNPNVTRALFSPQAFVDRGVRDQGRVIYGGREVAFVPPGTPNPMQYARQQMGIPEPGAAPVQEPTLEADDQVAGRRDVRSANSWGTSGR